MNCLIHWKRGRIFLFGLLWLALATWAYGATFETARLKLEKAKEDLRISQATEARIASELDQLRNSGNTSPEVLKEYETYLARVHEMVIENQRIVREMEAAYARMVPPEEPSDTAGPATTTSIPDPDLPKEEEFDREAALDRELRDSLAAFDEMLLRELDEIRLRSSEKMMDLAEEAAAAVRRLRDKGIDLDTSSPEGPSNGQESGRDQEEGGEDSQQEGKTPTEGGMDPGDGAVESEEGTGQTGEFGSRGKGRDGTLAGKPGSRSEGYEDDDIVARQIREAAEKETDPELKEKLWREYEEYKRGSRP
jgi:hypothetical protein